MPRRCAVRICDKTYPNPTGKGFTYFKFPSDNNLKDAWIEALNQKDFYPTKTSAVCERHFSPGKWITHPSGRRYLRKDTVPDIIPGIGPTKAAKCKKNISPSPCKSSSAATPVSNVETSINSTPSVTQAGIVLNSSSVTPSVTQAGIVLNSSSVTPSVTQAGIVLNSPSVTPSVTQAGIVLNSSSENSLVKNAKTPVKVVTPTTPLLTYGSTSVNFGTSVLKKNSRTSIPLLSYPPADSATSSKTNSSCSTIIKSHISLPTPLTLQQQSDISGLTREVVINFIPAIAYKDF